MPNWPELAPVLAGLALLIVGVAWRVDVRRQTTLRLREALTAFDPTERRAALEVVSTQGLSRYLSVLAALPRTETDPTVLDALAVAVSRNQWEPADDVRLVDLRLWASRWYSHRHTRPIPDTSIAEVGPRSAVGMAESPIPIAETTVRSPLARRDECTGTTVIVTGAGGAAGVAVVRALRARGHRVVAADADPSAVGLRLGHDRGVLPGGDDPDFVVAIRSLAERTGAQAVISTVAEELVALAEGEDVLRDDGVRAWVPKPEAVQRCTDKLAFAKVLAEAQLATPATALGEDLNVAGPWIVKPRFGRGSRDVYAVDDLNELHWAARRVPEPIVQTRVEGWEFTVDALVERGGSLVGAVPRRRLETKAGISTKGLVFEGPAVVDGAARVLRAIGLAGPANVQGFVGPDDAITFIEVNPRFSGGLPLSLAAGADLVGEYLRGVLGYPLRSERLEFRSGVTMLRHFDEVFEG